MNENTTGGDDINMFPRSDHKSSVLKDRDYIFNRCMPFRARHPHKLVSAMVGFELYRRMWAWLKWHEQRGQWGKHIAVDPFRIYLNDRIPEESCIPFYFKGNIIAPQYKEWSREDNSRT